HDRVDALAVLQADFPVFFAAVDLEAALGQLVHRHLLPFRQADHEPAALAGQLGDAALADDLAALQNSHAVANLLDFTEQVGVQKDGRAAFFEPQQNPADLAAADGIDAVGRLVEENHLRVVDHRLGDADALLHALGVGADFVVH